MLENSEELCLYLAVLRRRLLPLLAVCIVALGVAWVATPKRHHYTSRTVIYVGATNFAVSGTEPLRFDPTLIVERLIQTYADMPGKEPGAKTPLQFEHVPRKEKQAGKEIAIPAGKDTQLL